MKTIGLLGGMSYESTLDYYRILNEETKILLGKTHSVTCLIHSLDFHEIEILQRKNDWDTIARIMVDKALQLKHGGAACIVICANTMHKVAGLIRTSTGLPVIHIADEVGKAVFSKGLKTLAFLGTEHTMTGKFYKDRLNHYGIELVIPSEDDRKKINTIIYEELILGDFKDSSKETLIGIIDQLKKEGIEGVILACTELPLLIFEDDVELPLFNSTQLHVKGALDFALDFDLK